MTDLTFTVAGARALHLAAQGMLQPRRRKARKEDVIDAIRRMGVLQIDTINVVARSPYLVLWSRLGDYRPQWLDEHLAEGALFEYWAHEACFVPIEDYALLRHTMLAPDAMGWKYKASWMEQHAASVAAVLAHIDQHGPTRSAHFARTDGKSGGWWAWKPEKRALEMLLTSGVLMVARRHNFERVYDLAERVHPAWRDSDLPPIEHTRTQMVLNAVRALGVCKAAWIADYYRTRPPRIDPQTLVASGDLLRARVLGWEQPVYLHPDHFELAQQAADGLLQPSVTTLLSPFDPIVWDRRRALELFDFDYRLECYTPAPKRRYGYFTLPILRRGALVGRVDAKAHRSDGVLEVKSIELEAQVRVSARLCDDIAQALVRCARWHGCPQVLLMQTVPAAFEAPLQAALARASGA